ncbi:MAG: hypothetical protein IKC91_00505 [Clostridia bacterium]|nr:hypothetical protein [Clostridia bacterium]
MAACEPTGDGGSSTPTTTVKTDNCAIANGNFEYYSDDSNLQLVTLPESWTKSTDLQASTRSSGIVQTDAELWTSMTTSTHAYSITGDNPDAVMNDVEKVWDEMSVLDRLEFYADFEALLAEYNSKNATSKSLSDFELYNEYTYSIAAEDLPDCANPGKHDSTDTDNTAVLMISNQTDNGYGTAQRYSSTTTVTLDPGTAAKVSVWVKTQNLTYDADGEEADGLCGANISVTHTVGGKKLDQMQITNINTKGVTANNGWKQYTVYIRACSYATSTFNIELGLGQEISENNYFRAVNGYAFFDDVDMEIISNSAYETATAALGADVTCGLNSSKEEKVFETDAAGLSDKDVFTLDLYQSANPFDLSAVNVAVDYTKATVNNVTFTPDYTNLGVNVDKDIKAVTTWNALNSQTADNAYLNAFWADDFNSETFPFDKASNMIFLMSTHGAAYTAKMQADANNEFVLAPEEYVRLSFWVKTSDVLGYTGATIKLFDGTTQSTLGSYNTTTMAKVDSDEQEDIHDGWVQCFFFIGNDTESAKSYRLEFSYGLTDVSSLKNANYLYEGYAAFAGFESQSMTEKEFTDYAGSATNGTVVSLMGKEQDTSKAGFDQVGNIDKEKIENGYADPMNYKGVNAGSVWVGGTVTDMSDPINATNANETAGLLNKTYAANYTSILTPLATSFGTTATWQNVFGGATQPLVIYNAMQAAYGYYSESLTLSANGYSAVSMRVKVSAGAKAYIYLIDTSDIFEGYTTVGMDTVNVTYWYDDEGNVCTKDPEADDFNAKSDVAFYRTENGLYKNNLDKDDTATYANLKNYDVDDEGNLIVETDASGNPLTTYDYSDSYTDDGIAFYENEGKFYADKDCSMEVKDFGTAFATQYARYISKSYLDTLGSVTLGDGVTVTGANKVETVIVVDGTDANVAGKWVTVSFYIHTGNDSFPYRLEAFSGSRDGSVKNPAGSTVIFDVCNTPDLNSTYDGLLEEAIDDMGLEKDVETGRLVEKGTDTVYADAQYYTYTFYDDTSFQRYDKTLDKNNNGNPYGTYAQSDRAEELTYLYYESTEGAVVSNEYNYTMFLNYAPMNQHVSPQTGVDVKPQDTETTEWWESPDFWFMLSSIIVAVVLIVILLIMLTTRLIKKFVKTSDAQANNRYNAKKQRYIRKLNLAIESDEDQDANDDNPYND